MLIDKSMGAYWKVFVDLLIVQIISIPDSNVHGAYMGPFWVLSAPDGPHVGPMNLAIRDYFSCFFTLKHHSDIQANQVANM